MNVLVLIAGVHDPKWPIVAGVDGVFDLGDHQIMSPFDEAALEMALRARDADPTVMIAVRVAGGAAGVKVARSIAALNIADVATVEVDCRWDQRAMASALASLCVGADLILIGREFGDYDDGLVPPALAGMADLSFFSRAQTIEPGAVLRFAREAETRIETFTLKGPALVSVTNDRRTRLRKPLMKNVMMARNAVIGEETSVNVPTPGLVLHNIMQRSAGRSQTQCRMLEGDPAQQAQTLAALLWEARL